MAKCYLVRNVKTALSVTADRFRLKVMVPKSGSHNFQVNDVGSTNVSENVKPIKIDKKKKVVQ